MTMEPDAKQWVGHSAEGFLRRAGLKEKQAVLDFGSNVGNYARAAARVVGQSGRVYALDKDRKALNKLKRKAGKENFGNIECLYGSADDDIPLPARSVDIVLLYDVLHRGYFPDQQRSAVLRSIHRALKPGGTLLVGIVPADSPWGNYYRRKGRDGHPFYSVACFYTCSRAIEIAEAAGFGLIDATSTLPTGPEEELVETPVADGVRSGWGFVGLRFALADAEGVSRPPEVRSVARACRFSVCSSQSVGRYGIHARGKCFGQSHGHGRPGISPTPSIGGAVWHLTG